MNITVVNKLDLEGGQSVVSRWTYTVEKEMDIQGGKVRRRTAKMEAKRPMDSWNRKL